MRRFHRPVVVILLGLLLLAPASCTRMVEVRTGTRVVSPSGEVISDSTRLVRVPASEAGKYGVNTIVQVGPKDAAVQQQYAEAQAALSANDIKTAKAKLEAVVKEAPTYRKAGEQLGTIRKGGKPKPDIVTPPADPTPPPSNADTRTPPAGGTEAGALSRWTPDALQGFTAAKPSADPLSVSREYTPGASSPALSLVIVAEQYRTAAEARQALASEVTARYPKDAAAVVVKGRAGRFGTDGKRFAALGFTDGAVFVALEMSVRSGSPSALRAPLEQVVSQLP